MPTDTRDEPAIRQALEKIRSSASFSRSERQSRFLQFLVERQLEGREAELKESVIALEVFDRRADYDPKLDAVVRTEAVRLRARLSAYYASEGSADPVVIELPKGGYKPVFRHVDLEVEPQLADEPGVEAPPADRRVGRVWLAASSLIVLALAVAAFAWWRPRGSEPVSIAVLPLDNLGDDPASDYFADGLTDEIIRHLSVIDGLIVRSRTSSFALKDKAPTVRDAGRQLDAEYILDGSVLRVGEQLRINAALIRVRDDFPLWTGKFDRELADVFAIQDEISRAIANSLRLNLGQGRRLYETNAEAFDLYLRGRHAMAGFPAPGRMIALSAVKFFDEAIARDATYAIAYAGKADALLAIDENIFEPGAYPAAASAAQQAVSLDPLLSEAQSAHASIRARQYAWQDAETGFRRALELNPNNALAHLKLGRSVLIPLKRFDEALREVRHAVALDPLSPYATTELAAALLLTGHYDETIEQARKALALDPSRTRPYREIARALNFQGRAAESLAAFEEFRKRLTNPDALAPLWIACPMVRAGLRDEAVSLLEERLRDPSAPTRNRWLAAMTACLDDKARTFEYLERMLARQDPGLVEMLASPELAGMRSDARFKAIHHKLNLPPPE